MGRTVSVIPFGLRDCISPTNTWLSTPLSLWQLWGTLQLSEEISLPSIPEKAAEMIRRLLGCAA